MGAHSKEDARVVFLEVGQGEVAAGLLPAANLHAHAADAVDLDVELLTRQAVAGDAVSHHAARLVELFEDGHGQPGPADVGRGLQSGRPGADDGNGLVRLGDFGGGDFDLPGVGEFPVADVAFQVHDVHGRVDLSAGAHALAEPHADAAADGGEDHRLADEFEGFGVFALADQGDVALDVDAGGAGVLAGRLAALLDGVDVRHALGVGAVDGFAVGEVFFVLVGHDDGADLFAVATAGAFFGVDVARLVADANVEVARLAGDGVDLAVGQQFDIQMPAGLDELGREDAHRAVVGGEGLVQPGHDAADGRVGLEEVDLLAGVGQVEGGLDAADAATDDKHRADGWIAVGLNHDLHLGQSCMAFSMAVAVLVRSSGVSSWHIMRR